jgi:hypothetical protein
MRKHFSLLIALLSLIIILSGCKQDKLFTLQHKTKINKVYVGDNVEINKPEKPVINTNTIAEQQEIKKDLSQKHSTKPVFKTHTSNTASVKKQSVSTHKTQESASKNLHFTPKKHSVRSIIKNNEKSSEFVDLMQVLIWLLIIILVTFLLRLLGISLSGILGVVLLILIIMYLLTIL